ncbi:glycosyltransferase [Cytobacillus oceanisediminis]|uniref:glycosyltransferase family 4 protein n=1 Tax=Cytobacillus oceanisediminis TaxID=665099 RepID=UPI001D13E625|nr:glycosyltransferase [Cytobacillus oceanisediminis]MCC3648461.1 glycosyltransferase [Cytobacillus oceanisediminis]
MKKKVLVMAGYYLPSIKGGGPIQSIKNLVENLSDRIDFYIVAADRDFGDTKPFLGIKTDNWVQVGKAKVYYTNPSNLTWRKTAAIIKSVNYDVLYLNSFFSYKYSALPMMLSKFKIIQRKPIVIAPRGQFSIGALGLKKTKKKLYIKLTKLLGLYNNIKWQATAESEKEDIIKVFDNSENIFVANNLTVSYEKLTYEKILSKTKGEIKIVFISRIHPKKNLKMAIQLLEDIQGKIEFNVFGPIEDKGYWDECKQVIKKLPKNITVSYKGVVDHDNVMTIFKEHHVFLFPTLGENFGHVISEALIGGCPVIISDQSPWRQLEKRQVGWDISLENEKAFIDVLQYCVNCDNKDYQIMSKNAFEFGKEMSNRKEDIEKTYKLFD